MIPEVSIIIKSFNEEKNIDRCIRSVLKSTKGLNKEIILADSLSTDKTIQLAKRYPIKIVQLQDVKDRSCGAGAQLGYQYSKGKYIFLIDADMELKKEFIEKALSALKKMKNIAALAGKTEYVCNTNNIEFLRRSQTTQKYGNVKYLSESVIYNRTALEEVGYMANRNLHSFEELELDLRLNLKGYMLKRIKIPQVKHYMHSEKSLNLLLKRWKSKYFYGYGELIRASLGKKYFFQTVWNAKLPIFILLWWILIITSLIFDFFLIVLLASFIWIIIFCIKKKSIKKAIFSIITWHIIVPQLLIGIGKNQENPTQWIKSRIIRK